jgi:exodeoxyribonuclease VIII
MHFMLDIETVGTKPGAAIPQVGITVFDPRRMGIISGLCLNLDLSEQYDLGLKTDNDTIEWWAKQDTEVQKSVFQGMPRLSLDECYSVLDELVVEWEPECVWAQGASFDFPILEVALGKLPWSFRAHRCSRTLFKLLPEFNRSEIPGAHNALVDATAQAIDVQRALRALRAV